jgi:segregation and condensation protein B
MTDKEIIEALLFATEEPLSARQLADIVFGGDSATVSRRAAEESVLGMVDELNAEFETSRRAFRIVHVAGGYQFATRPEYGSWLGKMLREKTRRKLSVSALESLAVIAYRQPVTKPEIEAIRGVNIDYVLRTLLERNLVAIVGRAASPGRPLLYGTTQEFLKRFGLNDLSELPKPREIDELLAEAEYEVEKRLLKEQEERLIEEETGTRPDVLEDRTAELPEDRAPELPASARTGPSDPSSTDGTPG